MQITDRKSNKTKVLIVLKGKGSSIEIKLETKLISPFSPGKQQSFLPIGGWYWATHGDVNES